MKNVKVIFDRRKTVAKTGIGTIDICVYLKEGQRKFESVGSATPEEWEVVAQGREIQAKIKHYEQIINAMLVLGEEMTIEVFNKHACISQSKSKSDSSDENDTRYLYKGNDQRQSFPEFIEDYLDKEGLRSGSRRNIVVVIDSLKKAKMLKTFADLTPVNLIKYDEYLHAQGDKSLSTIYNYHKKLHKYTHILWRNEMIPSDPYNHVQFKRGTHKERQPLTEDELLKLRDAKLPPKLDSTRDLFIFMAYTGLAYVDMCHFNFKTMAEKQGNTYYINGERIKTGSKFYAPILPPAQAVLEKYNYKLPIITNQKLNDYLDLVREKLSMNKKITCHVARHSFATLLLTYDFTVEKTARALGHKDIKTTQVYAKVLKKTIVDRTEQLVTEIK
jgi:site-specific recombinase XerD